MNTDVSIRTHIGKLLLDESPLLVVPSLAERIGLEDAVVLQQLHFLIHQKLRRHKDYPNERERDIHDGRVWVWNSYKQWKENYFRFSSERSLQRIFLRLEKRGLIVSGNYNESTLNKTKWYSINYDHPLLYVHTDSESPQLNKPSPIKKEENKTAVEHASLAPSTHQSGTIEGAGVAPSYTKNFKSKNTTNTTTTSELSSYKHGKQDPFISSGSNTFKIPETREEGEKILRDVMRIIYPFDDQIRNKNNLKAVLRKKLMSGTLEIPESWELYQSEQQETEPPKRADNETLIDGEEFYSLRIKFNNLRKEIQNKYLEIARRKVRSIASAVSEENILRTAIYIWSQGKNVGDGDES